jgi:hypothetical protein
MLALAASVDRHSERLAHGPAPSQWIPARVRSGLAPRLGVLLMFHPVFEVADIYETLRGQVSRWIVVHVGTLLFIGLILHGPPNGPVGLLCFAAAAAVLARSQRTATLAVDAAQGGA